MESSPSKFPSTASVAPPPLPDVDVDNADCGLETLYPVALLINELKSDDLRVRLEAVKKIPKIAEKLGHERTRKDILPFFSEVLCDEEDVLYAMAELLGNFVGLIGGRRYTHLLLPPLEKLAAREDTRTRNRAVLSLRILAGAHTQQNLELYYIPMIKRLAKFGKIHPRVAACGLLSSCYKRVSTTARSDLRTTYRMLSVDKSTEVREAAADNLGELARVIEAEYLRSFIMPIFLTFTHDQEDTVRVLTILACYKISQVLSFKYKEQLLLSVLREIVRDPSWRVRVEMASRIVQLQKGLGPELSKKGLISVFVTLMTDEETCVRAMTLSKIIRFARKLDRKSQGPFIIKSVMPHIGELIDDRSKQVKMTLAAMTNGFCHIVGKGDTIEYVVPAIAEQLNSDCPEARSAIVSRLDIVFEMIGAKSFVQLLLPDLIPRCEDPHWETRFSVIDSIPALATQLGVEDFDQQLMQYCLGFLQDPVFMVRDKAVTNLKTLVQLFGVAWCDLAVVPTLVEMASHASCFRRMTVLFAINKIAEYLNAELVTRQFLPLVLKLAEDHVPNVRLNTAKTIKVIGPLVEKEAWEPQLVPVLDKLIADADIDVKFFAQDARTELFPHLHS